MERRPVDELRQRDARAAAPAALTASKTQQASAGGRLRLAKRLTLDADLAILRVQRDHRRPRRVVEHLHQVEERRARPSAPVKVHLPSIRVLLPRRGPRDAELVALARRVEVVGIEVGFRVGGELE